MKKLFLASSFIKTSKYLPDFAGDELYGNTVTFIPTATIPEKIHGNVSFGKRALQKLGFIVDELEISTTSKDEISNKLRKNDAIYIAGGNTFFLLQELKRTGTDRILIEQIQKGKLYIGESAGAMIAAPNIEYVKELDDCRKAPALMTFSALNLVDFYPLPHYKNHPYRKRVKKILTQYHTEIKLCPIGNHQAILIREDDMEITPI
ncbi:MAG: Type 1 glutamine amidotransferase-like domain-containing protein [Clostridiales Family XIII bacterium]|nr:Type 1 glutamine amidotransferase-like domain-containing protein [Clostridiales Family XIII bacterium]